MRFLSFDFLRQLLPACALLLAAVTILPAEPRVVGVLHLPPPAELAREAAANIEKVVPGMNAAAFTLFLTLATGDPGLLSFERDAPSALLFYTDGTGLLRWAAAGKLREASPIPGQLRNVGWDTTDTPGDWTLFHPIADAPPDGLWTDDLAARIDSPPRGFAELILRPANVASLLDTLEYPLLFALLDVFGPPDDPAARVAFGRALLDFAIDELAGATLLETRVLLRQDGFRVITTLEAREGSHLFRALETAPQPLPATSAPVRLAWPLPAAEATRLPSLLRPLVPAWNRFRLSTTGQAFFAPAPEPRWTFFADSPDAAREAFDAIWNQTAALAGSASTAPALTFLPSGESEPDPAALPGTILRAVGHGGRPWQATLTASRGRGVLTLDLPFAALGVWFRAPDLPAEK